ncbi:unnamed protein product [Blepharisma stoltei]|uniref:Uncharacterized protein n=1 Tax=Blepharisma stoltei TaxID=1481888 RepID=A0AAU9JZA3_9CILI|nr:unnamed protein product [Blepharisma stoltei]
MSWNFFDSWSSKRSPHKQIECSENDYTQQESKCKKRYNKWQTCTDTRGFNDPTCREQLLEKYYACVDRMILMKNFLEDKSLS